MSGNCLGHFVNILRNIADDALRWEITSTCHVQLCYGDITKADTDVIVCTTDKRYPLKAGVCVYISLRIILLLFRFSPFYEFTFDYYFRSV